MTRLHRTALIGALIALGMGAGTAKGQARDSVQVAAGARLRLRTDSAAAWRYGRFGSVHSDTLVLRSARGEADMRFSLTSLQEIDVRESDHAAHRSNATLGMILGAAATVAVFHFAVQRCDRKHPHPDGPACGMAYVALPFYAMGGAGAGAIIGAAWPANHWRPVVVIAAQH